MPANPSPTNPGHTTSSLNHVHSSFTATPRLPSPISFDNHPLGMDIDPPSSSTGPPSPTGMTAEGLPAKRVKKKRRLSASNEIDPDSLDLDDSPRNKKPRKRVPTIPHPPSLSPTIAKSDMHNANPAKHTSADAAYFERIDRNARRPLLASQRSACPVWAKTRKALQAATEYLRNPVRTDGGSVEIGVGGVARGVILEGDASGCGTFWGESDHYGTIVTCL